MSSVHIEPGIYEHFKGQRYEVFGTARHSETEEVFVSYRKLYGDESDYQSAIEANAANQKLMAELSRTQEELARTRTSAEENAFLDLFAGTPRVVTLWSQGINQSETGTDGANAIINAHLLTGRMASRARGLSPSPASPTRWAGARWGRWRTSWPGISIGRCRGRRRWCARTGTRRTLRRGQG